MPPAALAAYNAIEIASLDDKSTSILAQARALLGALDDSQTWDKAAHAAQGTTANYAKAAASLASADVKIGVATLRNEAAAYRVWSKKSITTFINKYGNKVYKDKGQTYGIFTLITEQKFSTCGGLPEPIAGLKLTGLLCTGLKDTFGQGVPQPPKAPVEQYTADAVDSGQAFISEAHTIFSTDNGGQVPDKATSKQIAAALSATKPDFAGNGGYKLYAIVGSSVVVTIGGQVAVLPWIDAKHH